ncbi:MAG: hypothetical protein CSA20_05330 [Deltaproteobacteria bacterium]|nr:MAG: hypothetical protein CSA20_05330 [Deltaproteobacteria bacterium]
MVTLKSRKSDQIKEMIKQEILDGRYRAGDKLPPEAEIAEQLHVSKVSAREALRGLETEGLIEKRRGIFGGSFVSEPGPERLITVVANAFQFGELSVNSLKEFRQILEPGLAELAAKRRTNRDLRAMEEYLQAIRASIDKGDPDQTKAVGFHCLIANATHNDFISALMKAVMQVFQQVLAREPDLETAEKDIRYNELFYEHIKNRDGVKARQLMHEHFDTLEKIIEQRKRNGEPFK